MLKTLHSNAGRYTPMRHLFTFILSSLHLRLASITGVVMCYGRDSWSGDGSQHTQWLPTVRIVCFVACVAFGHCPRALMGRLAVSRMEAVKSSYCGTTLQTSTFKQIDFLKPDILKTSICARRTLLDLLSTTYNCRTGALDAASAVGVAFVIRSCMAGELASHGSA